MTSQPQGFPLASRDSTGGNLAVGDEVVIRSVNSCIKDLPEEDQNRLLALVGLKRTVVEFDRFGFVWLSFSAGGGSADFCLFPTEVMEAHHGC